MNHPSRTYLAVALALASLGAESRAQFVPYASAPGYAYSWAASPSSSWWGGYGGAGSTVQGDIDRGLGIFAMGLGQYNLNTAIAQSIESDRFQRESVFIGRAVKEQARRNQDRREKRVRETTLTLINNQTRLTERPEEADIMRGSALNALVRRIAELTVASPSSMRTAHVPVPGGTIEQAPMVLADAGLIISGARFTERHQWPLLLRGREFDEVFQAYEKAIDLVLGSINEGSLRGESVARVDRTVQDLQLRFERVMEGNPSIDAREARTFLRELAQAIKFLHVARAGTVLAEMMTYGGTTVGELVDFMSRWKLQFGPAEKPSERALYRALYPLLARQWELLNPKVVAQSNAG